MTRNKAVRLRPVLFSTILVLLAWAMPLWAHEGVDHGDGGETHPRLELLTVGPEGRFRITLAQLPDTPLTGQRVQFLIRLEEELGFDDPLLGGSAPFEPSSLEIWTENAEGTRSNLAVHVQDEPGVYGFEHRFPRAGVWNLTLEFGGEMKVSARGELAVLVEPAPVNWALLLFQAAVLVSGLGMVVQRFRSPTGSPWLYSTVVMAVAIGILMLVGLAWPVEDSGHLELAALTLEQDSEALGFTAVEEAGGMAPRRVSTADRFIGTVRYAVNRTTQVRSPLPGTVVFKKGTPRVGDQVRKGQVLGVVVNEFIHHDFAHLLNQRWELEKPVNAALEEQTRTEVDYQRAGSLLDLGVISKREFDQKELAFKQASIAAEKAKARLALHDSHLRQKDQHETELVSPIDGDISWATYAAGQRVYEDAPLFEIEDTSVVWVEVFALPEDLARIEQAQEMTLRSTSLNQDFDGRLVQIRPDVDEASKTLRVIYEVSNTEHWLKPGMSLDVYPKPESPTIRQARMEKAQEAGD